MRKRWQFVAWGDLEGVSPLARRGVWFDNWRWKRRWAVKQAKVRPSAATGSKGPELWGHWCLKILFGAFEPPPLQGTHKWGHCRSIDIDDRILALQERLSTLKIEQHIRRVIVYLRYLTPPLLVQMSLSSMHIGSPSQPRPSSPANGPYAPNSDSLEDQADPAIWRRKYLALRETVNNQTSSKRKSG